MAWSSLPSARGGSAGSRGAVDYKHQECAEQRAPFLATASMAPSCFFLVLPAVQITDSARKGQLQADVWAVSYRKAWHNDPLPLHTEDEAAWHKTAFVALWHTCECSSNRGACKGPAAYLLSSDEGQGLLHCCLQVALPHSFFLALPLRCAPHLPSCFLPAL